MTPPWLPLPAALPGREAELAALAAAVAERPLVGVVGPPGVGKTTLVGAYARATGRPLFAVSLLGCRDADDAQRAIGAAAGAAPAGDEGAALALLRGRVGLLLVVDDVESADALAPVERLLAAVPGASAVLVTEAAAAAGPAPLVVGEPGGEPPGTALLRRLGEALGVAPEAALAALPPDAAWLAAWPMGVAAGALPPLPAAALRPDLADRVILRRGVAARLVPPEAPSPEPARRALAPVLELARGGHPAHPVDPRDVLLLRALRARTPEPGAAAELHAAMARALTGLGQPGAAAAALDAAPAEPGFSGRASLAFARAELAFSLGDLDQAWSRALEAAEAYGAAGEPGGRAGLWRRAAERLTERREVERAEEAWRRARQASRLLGDASGLAAALRGAASLALSRGEWVGAGALFEEALEGEPTPTERVNLRLGELALALVRGEPAAARRGLALVEEAAGDDELARANLARRRADALLRGGDAEAAVGAADQAAQAYARLGEGVAHGAALRLGADAAALAGRPADAHQRYEAALRAQVRSRDWSGLERTLDHAASLLEAGGRPDRARLMREMRAGVQRARGVG